LRERSRLRRDEIPQSIRRVVPAYAFFVGIDFQNIFGTIRIMLQRRQTFSQPPRNGYE